MKIAVTGGTGFIGNHVVNALLQRDAEIIVTGTNLKKAAGYDWFKHVTFFELDINKNYPEQVIEQLASADKLIHLAWSGLPNYKSLFHFEENLFPQYLFLKKLIKSGLKDITVAGTCFEYGMREGCLDASMQSDPQNAYALAKDTLRKFMQQLQKQENFKLKWLRLFYLYGKGQASTSILSQLENALKNGQKVFNMSGGAQLRDYLSADEAAETIADIALDDNKDGIYNVCSGKPVTIKKLVEDYLEKNNASIQLNLGFYPYPDYEPMAFWGANNLTV